MQENMQKSSKLPIDERLRNQLKEFKPAELKIARYLLADYPMAGLVSITELSASCDVSTPTVMRTLKRIGFTSFVSFQKELKKELSDTLADPIAKHNRWAAGAPPEHILNQRSESVLTNLRETMNHISYQTFNQVVDLLADESVSLHLVGGRITHAFSDYLGTHLEVMRGGVYKLPGAVSLWSHHLLDMNADDVLIIFDVRRYETDLLNIARLSADKGIKVVLFTDQWMSPIANTADFSFPAHVDAPSGWDSGVATLFIIEALITEVERKLWPQASERMKELEGIFDHTGRFKGKGES
jgi:DNA-binding MurR/RpiR family transcriptional regulator